MEKVLGIFQSVYFFCPKQKGFFSDLHHVNWVGLLGVKPMKVWVCLGMGQVCNFQPGPYSASSRSSKLPLKSNNTIIIPP